MADIIMDILDDFYTASIDDELDAQCDIISLNGLAADIGMGMRDTYLDFRSF